MRTLLREVLEIENHLLGKSAPEEQLLFDAKLIIDAELRDKTAMQNRTYDLIRLHGRRQLKAELQVIRQKLFTEPTHQSFADRIRRLFL